MSTRNEGACRYRIIVRGECGDMLAAAIDGLAVESRPGSTCVVAAVRDESDRTNQAGDHPRPARAEGDLDRLDGYI